MEEFQYPFSWSRHGKRHLEGGTTCLGKFLQGEDLLRISPIGLLVRLDSHAHGEARSLARANILYGTLQIEIDGGHI